MPAPLKPDAPLSIPDVHLNVSPIKLTPEEKEEIEKFFGVQTVNLEQINQLKKLGIHLSDVGVKNLTETIMFMNQQALLPVVIKLSEIALRDDGMMAPEVAKALGYLSEKLSKAGLATRAINSKDKTGPGRGRPRNHSFAPGETVLPPTVNVQVNNVMPRQ